MYELPIVKTVSPAEAFENYSAIIDRIKAHGDLEKTKIVAVTKTVPATLISGLLEYGIRDFGENYARELEQKIIQIANPSIRWHMIGALQTRAIKKIARDVYLWHSVARLKELDILAFQKIQSSVLLQVNLSDGDSRNGISLKEIETFLEYAQSNDIEVTGLMTVLPQVSLNERRSMFRRVYKVGISLGLSEFSMGMTQDFECAVEEGSTMVRIGRAIFGARA